jgi:hypothetical protein
VISPHAPACLYDEIKLSYDIIMLFHDSGTVAVMLSDRFWLDRVWISGCCCSIPALVDFVGFGF